MSSGEVFFPRILPMFQFLRAFVSRSFPLILHSALCTRNSSFKWLMFQERRSFVSLSRPCINPVFSFSRAFCTRSTLNSELSTFYVSLSRTRINFTEYNEGNQGGVGNKRTSALHWNFVSFCRTWLEMIPGAPAFVRF